MKIAAAAIVSFVRNRMLSYAYIYVSSLVKISTTVFEIGCLIYDDRVVAIPEQI